MRRVVLRTNALPTDQQTNQPTQPVITYTDALAHLRIEGVSYLLPVPKYAVLVLAVAFTDSFMDFTIIARFVLEQ